MAGTGSGGVTPFRVGQKWRPGSADHVDTITELNHEKQTVHYLCELDGAVHVTGMHAARAYWTLVKDVPDLPPVRPAPELPAWKRQHGALLDKAIADAPIHHQAALAYVAIAAELRKVNS